MSTSDLTIKPLSISSDAIDVEGDGLLIPIVSVPTVSIDDKCVNYVVMPVLAISVSPSVLLYRFDAVTSPVTYPVVYLLILVYCLNSSRNYYYNLLLNT